jgi:2-keto-4-pentenoate hydratase/2-oxohepta-3-ene-1,7-dioic acid hydratase in catechol pathway
MRLANLNGRATLVFDDGTIDVNDASNNHFPSHLDALVGRLDEIERWLNEEKPAFSTSIPSGELMRDGQLGPVIATPGQVFAIGLNYRTHAHEMGLTLPSKPMVFTKFPSSVTGANSSFPIVSERTDWEAELVVVISTRGRRIPVDMALNYVAGYCVGQDLSDRELQLLGSPAQFSMGKSYENFSPLGPWLTTRDEVENPNSLDISCVVNGVQYQNSNTNDMVFSVAELISYLSSIVEVRPGDIMFTGSPHGVGQGQTPPQFLKPGDVVKTSIEGLGSLQNTATEVAR